MSGEGTIGRPSTGAIGQRVARQLQFGCQRDLIPGSGQVPRRRVEDKTMRHLKKPDAEVFGVAQRQPVRFEGRSGSIF